MQAFSKDELEGAVLARRVARELSNEEIEAVSGAGRPPPVPTDWSQDYKTTPTTGVYVNSTNDGQDGDYKQDF
jgi:hypothetical protein